MKILQVHNRYRSSSPGGEDRVVDQEAAALRERGHAVLRFERHNDDIDGWSLPKKAAVAARVVWSGETRRDLGRVLRDARPDVVHLHNTFPLISPSVLYACRDAQVPAVMTIHNYRLLCASGELFRDGEVCHECLGRMPIPALRHGCCRASRLATVPPTISLLAHRGTWRRLLSAYIFLSEAQRNLFAPLGLTEERVFVKSNLVPGIEPSTARTEPIVVYAGRLAVNKGVDVLLDAWDRHLATAPRGGLTLVIAGAGPLEGRVAAWAASRPSVRFEALLSRSECASLVASARAVVVPSTWEEGFGLVVVEAMAAGVPSVASARGSLPELIADRVDGRSFPAGDVEALASVLDDVDDRPEEFRQLGRAARLTYERRFDPEANVERLLRIYDFAIARPVTASA